MDTASSRDDAGRVRVARYYHTARTAHLERLEDFTPGIFYYSRTRLDFDPDVAGPTTRVMKCSALRMLVSTRRLGVEILEVPEPLAVRCWPQLVLVHAVTAMLNTVLVRRRIELVSYAIENLPQEDKVARELHVPKWLGRALVRGVTAFLVRTSGRIAFGTEQAQELYRSSVPGRAFRRTAQRLFWALPAPEQLDVAKRLNSVCFLGTFEDRKGIVQLLEAWPVVKGLSPALELILLGKGEKLDMVRSVAPSIGARLSEDPARSEIRSQLQQAKVVVLFSQPTPTWREQVGLPIVEALAAGCEIVTSDQTGIAEWLGAAGHRVLPAGASRDELANAIVQASRDPRSPSTIQRALPDVDGRNAADAWLTGVRLD